MDAMKEALKRRAQSWDNAPKAKVDQKKAESFSKGVTGNTPEWIKSMKVFGKGVS